MKCGRMQFQSLSTVEIGALTPSNQDIIYDNTTNEMNFRQNGAWAVANPGVAYDDHDYAEDVSSRSLTGTTAVSTLQQLTTGFTATINGVYWVYCWAIVNYVYGGTSAWRCRVDVDGTQTCYSQVLSKNAATTFEVYEGWQVYTAAAAAAIVVTLQWQIGTGSNTLNCDESYIEIFRVS